MIQTVLNYLNRALASAIGTCIASYLVWRIWSFTIRPMLQPSVPRPLPYLVPFLGHTLQYMTNPDALFHRGYQFAQNGEPFALSLGAKNIIVLTSNRDVATVWKDTMALTFDPFVQDLMTFLGMSKKTRATLFREEPEALTQPGKKSDSSLVSGNPYHKAFYHLQMEWVKQQLSGDMLAEIGGNFLGYIKESLNVDSFSPSFVLGTGADYQTVSVRKWVRYSLVHSATKAFFGNKMLTRTPTFLTSYFQFEEAAWKMLFQYPRLFAEDLYGSMEATLSAMTQYYDIPHEARPETVWMFKTIETEMRHLGLSSRDVGIMTFMLFWGSNNNAHVICFWIISHILTDPNLLASVRAETSKACSSTGSLDLEILTTSCPHLDAAWHEGLRVYTATTLVRVAVAPTSVNGKTINLGDQVMSPFRQFHLNRDQFGNDASDWNPGRFMDSDKGLQRSKAFHPFGGGTTYCPGRFLAKQEVFTLVALILNQFDLELEEDWRMPTVNVREPSLGAMRPIGDLTVKVRKKSVK